MRLPDPAGMVNQRSIITTYTPLASSRFNLDFSGVLGLFGGDEAISAMAITPIHKGQRWLGWYNTPGSYQIAKQYALVATSKVMKGLFPGSRIDATRLFGFDVWQGPRFHAAHYDTTMESTGHLACVVMKQCAAQRIDESFSTRESLGTTVTLVKLNHIPAREIDIRGFRIHTLFAIVPIAASFAACGASGLYRDWVSFSLILFGILSNGISCLAVGSATLRFTHHMPASGAPGDGILDSGRDLVLLVGEEGAVNSITLGKFSLDFPPGSSDAFFGYCAFLFTIQSIAQLLVIPQGSLFGQLMFIASLAVSWIYNAWVSSLDTEEIQWRLLWDEVLRRPSSTKYRWSTRTSAVVFALCVLSPADPRRLLDAYLPSDTAVWKKFKDTVSERLHSSGGLHAEPTGWELEGYSNDERVLFQTLYHDAKVAYETAQTITSGGDERPSRSGSLSTPSGVSPLAS